MAKVSVIVPIYNSEKYLKRCLDSLINQTLEDLEIILVNDGSTDGSRDIILKYMSSDKRIKLIDKANGGQASARNLGLSQAIGEYIVFIDSDDYVQPNLCERLYQTVLNGYDIVVTDYYIIDGNNKEYYKTSNHEEGVISLKDYLLTAVCPWNKIYRKSFLIDNKFKFPEGIIYEDYASIPTLVNYNPKVYYLPEAFVNYIHTEVSTMRSDEYKTKYENIFVATNFLYEHLCNSEYKEELEYLISNHFLYLGSLNFYRFNKYDQLDKIADFMKDKFPKWSKNKYVKKMDFKARVLMKLFYHKKYNAIKFIQKIKR